jgi:hypothetical protein
MGKGESHEVMGGVMIFLAAGAVAGAAALVGSAFLPFNYGIGCIVASTVATVAFFAFDGRSSMPAIMLGLTGCLAGGMAARGIYFGVKMLLD